MFDFDKLRDAVKAFRLVLEDGVVVYNGRVGKVDATEVPSDKVLIKPTAIEPVPRRRGGEDRKGID